MAEESRTISITPPTHFNPKKKIEKQREDEQTQRMWFKWIMGSQQSNVSKQKKKKQKKQQRFAAGRVHTQK